MGVGYNTAVKWIERMEGDGLVGLANHVGRRETYWTRMGMFCDGLSAPSEVGLAYCSEQSKRA